MSTRSGLAGQVGYAPETTYGTAATPTKFVEPREAVAINDRSTWAVSGGVAAGRRQKLISRRRRTGYGADGSLPINVMNRGMGPLLQATMGTTVTPVQQGATAAWMQTHTLGDPWGKSLTVQAGVPDMSAGGVVRPHTMLGAKVTSATFACAVGGLLEATFALNGREFTDAQPLAAASYLTDVAPFSWADLTVKVGATASAATAVTSVRGVTAVVNQAQRLDRNYAGSGGKIAEPIINDLEQPVVTGTIDADYMDKTMFEDRFHSGASFGLVLEWVGGLIAGAFYDTFRIVLDGCVLTGDTAQLGGPDIVTGSFPFECHFDGTNLPKIETISRDVTL